ncbi:MAG: murein biosynthesis integral membrane protein MurJ [Ktedonobacterales bacterium]
MDRTRGPGGQERAQQPLSAERPSNAMNSSELRRSPQSPQMRVPAAAPPQAPPPPDDDRMVNPPWETETGRLASTSPRSAEEYIESGIWRWDSALEQSYAGVSISDMTGTGTMPAMVPLTPHDSWSKGLRAPSVGVPAVAVAGSPVAGVRGAEVEVDEQPSAQMRALRVGNLARATTIVSSALLFSRVLGLVRTTLFAATFGKELHDADAFTLAFTLPDAIFNIVSGGALASAFIPVFADYLIDKRDKNSAWHIASSALNLSMLALTILAAVIFIFASPIMHVFFSTLFAPGSDLEGQTLIMLTRIMLLQPIFLGGATVTIAILQARQHFILPALGQVIYTASLIIGIEATQLDNKTHIFGGHLGIAGPAFGVVLGAVLQLLIQIPGLARAKMQYRLSFDIFHPGVRQMFRLMVPRLINATFLYISVFFNRILLAPLPAGVTYGYVTAFTLIMLPVGVFGMAVSQAAFPTLAAMVSANQWDRLRDTILRTFKAITYLAIPSALGMIVLAEPICRLVLNHGTFDPASLPYFWQPLVAFAIGLLGLSLIEILTRSFYALHDSRTPVEVSILQFMFVIALSIIFLNPFGADGLALATSLGALGEALVLLLLLGPRIGGIRMGELWLYLFNVLLASVVMALAARFTYTLALVALPQQTTSWAETLRQVIRVFSSIGVACVVYFILSRFLGIDDVISLDRIAKRLLGRR